MAWGAQAAQSGSDVISSLLNYRAANKATEAQKEALAEALAFEREKEAARQREWKMAQEEALRRRTEAMLRWEAWNGAKRAALGGRYSGQTLGGLGS